MMRRNLPRYRIIRRVFDGAPPAFYPQRRFLCFWLHFADSPQNGGGYIHHDSCEGAAAFIEAARRYARSMRPPPKRQVVMIFDE